MAHHNNLGHHHLHKRKRIHHKKEQYPHPDKRVRFLDNVLYCWSFLLPVFSFSQVSKIWWYKDAAGVSITAWAAYTFGTFIWLIYGFVHKENYIIVNSIICAIINILVLVGAIIYM